MKKVLAISSVLLGVVFLAGCGQQPVSQTQPTTPAPVEKQPVDSVAQWNLYKNDTYKIEFKYNSKWSLAPINTGSGHTTSQPFILLWSGETSDAPCQDVGCPPKSGDRDELTKGDTFEGAPPLNPWFKILRVRGNKWVSIQVTDVVKNCQTETDCQQYTTQAPLEQKIKADQTGYQTYNDFIELISTLKFNE